MIHASLFSGIGGFDLAAEWAGWANAFNCEIDKFCQKVLRYHFPNAVQYGDITTTDFTQWHGRIDVLTGGFPCQPFSTAGKRLGTSDNRYLWPQMLRAIRQIAPRWVVGENVYGLVNWSGGLVLETVCADLEDAGYEIQPYIIPACAVGAPHRRDRIWFVAHRNDAGPQSLRQERHGVYGFETSSHAHGDRPRGGENQQEPVERSCRTSDAGPRCEDAVASDSDSKRFAEQFIAQKPSDTHRRIGERGNDNITRNRQHWEKFPLESPICSRNDGLSDRLDGITFPVWCRESIKAFGNAIVPQVAYQIFDAINHYETTTN